MSSQKLFLTMDKCLFEVVEFDKEAIKGGLKHVFS